MNLDADTCYRAMSARDTRFDGRFFVAVSSTRIYCRPICTVKRPKRENCKFYPSAAAAESAGYRPCLRCRPELAPGNASVDAVRRIAQGAARLIEDGTLDAADVETIAARLGITDRHLRRVFQAEFGVTPVAFVQTQRLLLAKRLLTDTALAVTEIAFASGFGSVRRFNALFKERYRLSPKGIRRAAGPTALPDALSFELAFRPPFDWDGLLAFLRARAVAGVESIEDGGYRRTVHLRQGGKTQSGWIEVTLAKRRPALRVAVSTSLAKRLPAVLERVKDLMDLSCNPTEVAQALGALAARNPGARVPGAFDGFEVAVRAILGQQVSVGAARTLAGRFARKFGEPIETPFDSLATLFPAPAQVADATPASIVGCGVTSARARSLLGLARAMHDGALTLTPGVDVEGTLENLRRLPGIGEWTAQYIAMRALAWPDAFPHTDLGVMKAMKLTDPKRVLAAAERWRPWRAYAVMHLWESLGKKIEAETIGSKPRATSARAKAKAANSQRLNAF
jgi:AraC family transcriptional regulator, regulatory protein of adaptative response / DNA-3-methyladenine glycosylase II